MQLATFYKIENLTLNFRVNFFHQSLGILQDPFYDVSYNSLFFSTDMFKILKQEHKRPTMCTLYDTMNYTVLKYCFVKIKHLFFPLFELQKGSNLQS